jgi:hypothetical protein
MSVSPLVALGAVALVAAGCSSSASTPSSHTVAPVLMYTCCTAATGHRIYHPGDLVTLHWMRSAGGQGRDKGTETLKTRLDGPFGTVAQAKRPGATGVFQVISQSSRVRSSTTPVTHVRVPDDAKPGLYNLTTTDVQGAGSEQSRTVIRVWSH